MFPGTQNCRDTINTRDKDIMLPTCASTFRCTLGHLCTTKPPKLDAIKCRTSSPTTDVPTVSHDKHVYFGTAQMRPVQFGEVRALLYYPRLQHSCVEMRHWRWHVQLIHLLCALIHHQGYAFYFCSFKGSTVAMLTHRWNWYLCPVLRNFIIVDCVFEVPCSFLPWECFVFCPKNSI